MDALAHATPILLRHLSYSAGAGKDVIAIDHAKVLEETELTHAQFIDFCILCGCDYSDTPRNWEGLRKPSGDAPNRRRMRSTTGRRSLAAAISGRGRVLPIA
jgi:hypothetical protein